VREDRRDSGVDTAPWGGHVASCSRMGGAVYALPAGPVALADPQSGVPLAVGVLSAAILPVLGQRWRASGSCW